MIILYVVLVVAGACLVRKGFQYFNEENEAAIKEEVIRGRLVSLYMPFEGEELVPMFFLILGASLLLMGFLHLLKIFFPSLL